MRREYEAAIGRLITNHTAMALFMRDHNVFLSDYDLDEAEKASILEMKPQLQGMCVSFSGKRKRILERPVARAVSLMGQYGDMLLRRYINLYPPVGDYTIEHQALVRFIDEALSSAEIDNIALIADVLHLESALFQALHAVIPGEELEHINDPEPNWEIQASAGTRVAVRNGVIYALYKYNLSGLLQVEISELTSLAAEDTAIIVYRRFGQVTNTLMRVSPTVLKALDAFGCGNTVHEAAILLSQESNASVGTTEGNLIKLVNQLSAQQVLVAAEE